MARAAWLLVLSVTLLAPVTSFARRPATAPPPRETDVPIAPGVSDRSPELPAFRPAATTTTLLHAATFDVAGQCNAQGWVAVDLTEQTGDYFHVDDYAGLSFGPVSGAQSLWCGARASVTGVLCAYQTLPGYGNTWNQAWCTKTCIAVGGNLDVSFQMRLDSEASYDAVTLEYTSHCAGVTGWTVLDGGIGVWDGSQNLVIGESYGVSGATDVRVRLRFESDGAWSDQDGLFDSDGAVHIDDLTVEGLAMENFEDESVGATSSNDWISCNPPGYGSFAGLVRGDTVLQDKDACVRDVTCLWAFFVGSTYDFACGGHPSQQVVPYGNANGQYLTNTVVSPLIELSGAGAVLNLEYWRYGDFAQDALVYPVWFVRDVTGGCPGPWRDRNFIPFFQNGWTRQIETIGDLVDLVNASHVQVSLGAFDMCGVWCGTVGSGECHSHAPLFDNVKVYRVDVSGPQWAIRDLDQFQDNFAEIAGPATGRTRADMANDISPASHLASIIPGDSAVVKVLDPVAGLGLDPVAGGAAVYGYVSVWPQGQADKTGAYLTQNATRWPVVGSWSDAGGVSWTCLRLDSSIVNGVAQPDIYCLDLNDNLFEPGDTVCFFYAAKNATGVETYAFGSNLALTSDDRNEAASDAAEFTCLPAGGPANILYVDGMDGRGAQPYWDTVFALLGYTGGVDRFDVRGPSSGLSNRLAGRVKHIAQLVPAYNVLCWDCGDLAVTLGDGSGSPEKTDDYTLINQFLANLVPSGGVYLGGDDVPSQLAAYTGPGALAFRAAYLPFSLVAGDHRPAYGVSPVGTAVGGGSFVVDPAFVIHGGCPSLNDFDVMQPTGATRNEITYGPGDATSGNGALLGTEVGNVRVLLGGFSFIYIRDDDEDGVLDRAAHFSDLLAFLLQPSNFTSATGPARATRLHANYPNPFNPRTTIAFSLARRGTVTLAVYDVAGRLVRRLVDGTADAGDHKAVWDGRNDAGTRVASGVYFYKLVAGDFVQTRKMVLLK